MPFSDLNLDRAFEEFNFSWILDPTLSGGPSQAVLLQLVYEARQGDRSAIFELVDTMCCTLREETFECFQKAHGPRPIRYRDWYYSKLLQFLEILVYEQLSVDRLLPDGTAWEPRTDRPWEEGVTILGSAGPVVQDDDVERAFEPGDNDRVSWGELIAELSEAPQNRLAALEEHLRRRSTERSSREGPALPQASPPAVPRTREWPTNRERNQIIRNLRARGKNDRKICEALDERTIEVLPMLRKHGVVRWLDGWDNPRLRRNIQQLFAKVAPLAKPVKR